VCGRRITASATRREARAGTDRSAAALLARARARGVRIAERRSKFIPITLARAARLVRHARRHVNNIFYVSRRGVRPERILTSVTARGRERALFSDAFLVSVYSPRSPPPDRSRGFRQAGRSLARKSRAIKRANFRESRERAIETAMRISAASFERDPLRTYTITRHVTAAATALATALAVTPFRRASSERARERPRGGQKSASSREMHIGPVKGVTLHSTVATLARVRDAHMYMYMRTRLSLVSSIPLRPILVFLSLSVSSRNYRSLNKRGIKKQADAAPGAR